jgi:hypothetical protein
MKNFQYMRNKKIVDECGLTADNYDSKGYVYVEICKSMYGLKDTAILVYEQLCKHLAPFGYVPATHTPGLWRHTLRCTTFTLAIDDFGIKYFSQADADHLFAALATKYTLTINWSSSGCLGFKIDWNYPAGHVNISMPK